MNRARSAIPVAAMALLAAGCSTTTGERRVAPLPPPPSPSPSSPAVPPGMQYLYGSGEGAAISVQAWRGLVNAVAQSARARPVDSVVLAKGATLSQPGFVPCGDKPLAAVFDVDETVLLNLGFEYDQAVDPGPFDPAKWAAWERTGATRVVATPGAAKALGVLRQLGVTVIFNSNRSVASASETQQAIEGAGLGPAVHKQTLFLQGDDGTGSRKDARRAAIAADYCVIAMGGDQLGDFSDLFNDIASPTDRRAATLAAPIASKWGTGWFVLPNPVYGTALKGGVDDIFPQDKRWTPPPTPSAPQEKQ